MSLRSLPPLLRNDDALVDILGVPGAVLAVPEPARAFALAGLAHLSDRHPVLVAVPTGTDAERLAFDLRAYAGAGTVETFPAWETLPFERVSPSVETMGRRLRAMWRLRHAGADAGAGVTKGDGGTSADGDARRRVAFDPGPRLIVAPVRALIQRLGPRVEDAEPIVVATGDVLDADELVERLSLAGYRREYQVEHRGEVAVRGGIVDVFSSTADAPVRIDLWGDEVDRLTTFDVNDQRSVADLERVEVFACRELLPTPAVRERARLLVGQQPWGRDQWERLAEGLVFDGMESWLPWLAEDEHLLGDLVGPSGQVVLVDPRRMRDRAAELIDEEVALAATLAETWGAKAGPGGRPSDESGPGGHQAFPRLHLPFERLLAHTVAPVLSLTSAPEAPSTPRVAATGWDPVVADAARLARQLGGLVRDGYSVTVCAEGEGSAGRVASILAEEGLHAPVLDGHRPSEGGPSETSAPAQAPESPADLSAPGVRIVVQPLEGGFVLPSAKLAVLAETDVTGRRRAHRQARPRARPQEGFFDDLAPGAYVVHHQHGVARYAGMVRRAIGGGERDYLLLEYRGGDKLYVPSDQIDAITPYTGGETPTLHRLGGSEWQRTKARVRASVREIAEELVALYRERTTSPGHEYAPDSPWQREMEEAFPYAETPDQGRAIVDVKADMEQPVPMDRLVCGDVGFGKTEVAIRATFKAVQEGRQAAVLVPTTLLAQQHFQTFSDRLAPYPVRVEVLSRFLTAAQARRVVDGLADGSVDLVIGTHRLLSSDVTFKDLGLLVVDEEQRFGVSHKEAIKALSTGVDVLTLTATPIPRTLEMSLTGIRDLSLINTPPAERLPILTYVGELDERAVSEAIRRELLREGQVFFVHNLVYDIEATATRLRRLVPEARIAVAHGQMDEGSLEKVVLDFWEGRYDVLVCTTIIESGIDMPTVNTLVVDRADRLGLGQLHQLRGRVGRAGQRAYAYLFFPPERTLTEEAYERLRTIGEHTELGSGFKIAMRDLEIRGAGNLLGSDQSGHIAAVGYDLYVQMVSEAVSDLKGEVRRPPAEIKLDLAVDAHLTGDYVAREDLRLEAYRRLAAVTTPEEVDDIRTEWLDRYGPLPPPAESLLAVGRLRAECVRTGVREVTVTPARPGAITGGQAVARLAPLSLKASAQVRLRRRHHGAVYKEDLGQLVVPLQRGADAPSALVALLGELVPPGADDTASGATDAGGPVEHAAIGDGGPPAGQQAAGTR